jgi:hypothetical protein
LTVAEGKRCTSAEGLIVEANAVMWLYSPYCEPPPYMEEGIGIIIPTEYFYNERLSVFRELNPPHLMSVE